MVLSTLWIIHVESLAVGNKEMGTDKKPDTSKHELDLILLMVPFSLRCLMILCNVVRITEKELLDLLFLMLIFST